MNPEEDLPPDVVKVAQKVVLDLLPTKSREIYETTYKRFMKWCEEKNIKTYSENVLLVYFADLAKKMKSSILWSQYSMVKAWTTLSSFESNYRKNIVYMSCVKMFFVYSNAFTASTCVSA
jgi:hypothetical protein